MTATHDNALDRHAKALAQGAVVIDTWGPECETVHDIVDETLAAMHSIGTAMHSIDAAVHRFEAAMHSIDAAVHRFEAAMHSIDAAVHRFEAAMHLRVVDVDARRGHFGSNRSDRSQKHPPRCH